MDFRDATHRILKLVEEKTGIPVRVTKDSTLPTHATVRMARGNLPVHLVAYNPSKGPAPDYLICYQCGHILRLFECAPDQRQEFVLKEHGRQAVREMLRTSLSMGRLPEAVQQQMVKQLFEGVMRQIRTYPIGIRVDDWIAREYPELRELQETSAKAQMQENTQVLSPQVKQMAPEKIYRLSVAMNGAFAQYWATRLSEPRFVAQYKVTPYWNFDIETH